MDKLEMPGCVHFVINATTVQPILAYPSQTLEGVKILAGVGWNELE